MRSSLLVTAALFSLAQVAPCRSQEQKAAAITFEELRSCLTSAPYAFVEGSDFSLSFDRGKIDYFTHEALAAGTLCAKKISTGQFSERARTAPQDDGLYTHLKLFADVVDRIRVELADAPDDVVLFEGAIAGMIKLLPGLADDAETQQARKMIRAAVQAQSADRLQKLQDAFADVLDHARSRKPDAVRDKDLIRWAIGGMLAAVDNHAAFITPEGNYPLLAVAPASLRPVRQPTTVRAEGDAIVIRLSVIEERSANIIIDGIERERRRLPTGLRGFVLDLRGNEGGRLPDAVALADLFLDDGVIASVRGRDAGATQVFRAAIGDVTAGMPIVVLIDSNTAAGAELIATALRDNQRAQLVGQRSAGISGIQSIAPLTHNHALRLTTQRWHRPKQASVAGGIAPDVSVPSIGSGDRPLAAAIEVLAK